MRRQQRVRQMAMQKAQSQVDVKWQAGRGMPGQRMVTQQQMILRRTAELTSEKVGKVPKGACVYVLEMLRPTAEGVRRALVQDAMGKNSGWLTAVDVDGEANLAPAREARAVDDDGDYDDRGSWLHEQQQLWVDNQFPKHDSIQGQQEKSGPKHMQMKQIQRRQRQDMSVGQAGKRSVVEARAGGVGNMFRTARAMGAQR